MKKIMSIVTLCLALNFGAGTAHAGAGLGISAISNFVNGHFLSAAISGGLGTSSILYGLRLVERGRVGWGVFFLVLEEEGYITSEDREFLDSFDIAEQQAFIDLFNQDLSEEDLEAELTYLYGL